MTQVALLNGSPRATHAQSSLAITLKTISAKLIADEPYLAPVLGRAMQASEILRDPALVEALRAALEDLMRAIRKPP